MFARSERLTVSPPVTDVDAPIGADTAFRCLIAATIVRLGLFIVEHGARVASPAHPARRFYTSRGEDLRASTDGVPFDGFVPTNPRLMSATQAVWVVCALLLVNVVLRLLGLPHVPMLPFERHIPHLSYRVVHDDVTAAAR